MQPKDRLTARGSWTRTGGRDILINSPESFPSTRIPQPPSGGWVNPGVSWLGSDNPFTLVPGSLQMLDVCNRANRLVVGTTVTLPWRVWRYRAGVREQLRLPLWVREPQLVGAVTGPVASLFPFTERKTATRFWFDLFTAAHLHGRAWLSFAVGADDQPVAGSLLQLDDAMISVAPDGTVTVDPYGYDPMTTDTDGYYLLGGQRHRVQLFHGPGVITNHGDSLGLALTVRNYITGTLHSGVPAGYLKYTGQNLEQSQADALKASWLKAHGGDRRSIAVLNAVLDFVPIAISPIDAQAKDMANQSLVAVAHAFNMSAFQLDAEVTSNTYANIQDRRQDFVDGTVQQFAQPQMDTLTSVLPYGSELRVDYRGYLLTDSKARTDYYAAGIAAGWMTPEEARAMEGLSVTMVQEG